MKSRLFFFVGGLLPATLVAPTAALAQTPGTPQIPVLPYNIGDAVRQAEVSRQPPLQRPAAVPILPQLQEPQLLLTDKEKLFIRTIKIEGGDFTDEGEAREIAAAYENRHLTMAAIYELADKLTTYYRNEGYLVAKAYVPAQDARHGVLRIKILPGRVGVTSLNNDSLVRSDYLQGVIDQALGKTQDASPIIHKDALERAMLLISDLPGANLPRIAIAPGQQPETSDFVFNVPSRRLVDGYLLGDNVGSPYTGRDRLSGGLNINSPLGFGDKLALYGIISDTKGLLNGRAAYSFPIAYDGLRGEIGAFRTTYALGGVYSDLDATGTANAIYASLTYAIKRSREESIYISGNFTHKNLDDKIFGISTANRSIDLGTITISRDTFGLLGELPLMTSTSFSFTSGYVNFPDPVQKQINQLGVDTVGHYDRINLNFTANLALTETLSLQALFKGQKSLTGNLDSSEQLTVSGYWGVRSYDEGLSADSGYLFSPELKYALPSFHDYRHSIGVFTDISGAWIENASYTTTQNKFTQLNDIGFGYYMIYEYMPGRFLTGKGQIAHTYGSDSGAQQQNRGTKGLVQIGITF